MPYRLIDYPARALVVLALLCAQVRADDRVSVGYVASTSIVKSGSGLSHGVEGRWGHLVGKSLELGAGAEVGYSGGRDASLTRFASLLGVAFTTNIGALALRIDEQIGWQFVQGHLTLDGIPIAGTETRSFHEELTVGFDAPLSNRMWLRARTGLVVDGIYPAGHNSTRVSPCVGASIVFAL